MLYLVWQRGWSEPPLISSKLGFFVLEMGAAIESFCGVCAALGFGSLWEAIIEGNPFRKFPASYSYIAATFWCVLTEYCSMCTNHTLTHTLTCTTPCIVLINARYMHIHVHACARSCAYGQCAHKHTYSHMCKHAQIHQTHTHTNTCMRTSTHTYAYMHTNTQCKQTNKQTPPGV